MTDHKVLLLFNSFSAHQAELDFLKTQNIVFINIKVKFLSANTTFVYQSLN